MNAFKQIFWTEHAKVKMRQYGLSKSKILSILRTPERKEQGIASGTTAAMQTKKVFGSAAKTDKRPPGEIWLMYSDAGPQRRIVSCWRYPGISKPGESIPIPQEIKDELLKIHDE